MVIYEKYRPKTFDEIIGQEAAVKKARLVCKRGAEHNAFWITGKSGQGKTTLARIIAKEVASDITTHELDADGLTPAGLEKITSCWCYSNLFSAGGGYALIINEAHGLRQDTVRVLLVLLERLARGEIGNGIIIFTTTKAGEKDLFGSNIDANPLISRCIEIHLAQRDLTEAFAKRIHEIACKEGLNGQPISAYLQLARDTRNNFRRMLEIVAGGEMLNN